MNGSSSLNTNVVPRLRAAGFALLSLGVLLHNHLVLGQPAWTAWAQLTVILAAYCATSWYALNLFFTDLRSRFDLGAALPGGRHVRCSRSSIYVTGAERSWIFFLPLFRVVDQTATSFRRALAFAHLAPLSYVAVILHVSSSTAGSIPLGPEIAKVLFIYGGSLYIAMIARTGDERHAAIVEGDPAGARADPRARGEVRGARALVASAARRARTAGAACTRRTPRLFGATERARGAASQILHSTSDGIIFVEP